MNNLYRRYYCKDFFKSSSIRATHEFMPVDAKILICTGVFWKPVKCAFCAVLNYFVCLLSRHQIVLKSKINDCCFGCLFLRTAQKGG